MKNLLLIFTSALLFSCGGKWSKEDKEELKSWWCEDLRGEAIFTQNECDCMLDQLMDKFSSFEDSFNASQTWDEDLNEWFNSLEEKCRE